MSDHGRHVKKPRRRRSFTAEFKAEIVERCQRGNRFVGQVAVFALGHGDMADPPLAPWTAEEITGRLDDTLEGWRSWSAIHQNYEGPWRELVRHSGRVLQAMTFAPTGAIVAAPTTSPPETVGGERNWDYRYTWVRDASLTMEALWVAACPDEANKFFAVLANAAGSGLQRDAYWVVLVF
jgi:alpha,alpha-trehalase